MSTEQFSTYKGLFLLKLQIFLNRATISYVSNRALVIRRVSKCSGIICGVSLRQLESPLSHFLLIVIQSFELSQSYISAVSLSCNRNLYCLTKIFLIISVVSRNNCVILYVSRNILVISTVSRDKFVIFYVLCKPFVISFVSQSNFVILFSDLPLVLAIAPLEPYLVYLTQQLS